MSKHSEQAAKLVELIELPHGVPAPMKEGTLLQQGLYAILLRHLPPSKAESAVQALARAYEDWNELRVCQAQEISVHLAGRGARTPDKLRKFLPAATATREYLQEVYQKTHGLDLAELREDPIGAGKLVSQMPYLGSVAGTFLLWVAQDKAMPVTPGLVRVLDRLGLMARTASTKKARAALEPIVSKQDPLRFAVAFGYVAERWCLTRNPVCWECPLREDCPHGRKVVKDWKVQQERLEVQRRKDEARRAAQELKDRAREERERKRAEVALERQREKEARAAQRRQAEKKSVKKTGETKGGAKKPGSGPAAKQAGSGAKPASKKAAGAPAQKASGSGSGGSRSGGAKAAIQAAAARAGQARASSKANAAKPASPKAPQSKAAPRKASGGKKPTRRR